MTKPSDRTSRIKQRLLDKLSPIALEIIDESHKHIGHAQAGGGGHYKIIVQSPELEKMPRVQAHRRIYEALADMMGTEIHALAIEIQRQFSD